MSWSLLWSSVKPRGATDSGSPLSHPYLTHHCQNIDCNCFKAMPCKLQLHYVHVISIPLCIIMYVLCIVGSSVGIHFNKLHVRSHSLIFWSTDRSIWLDVLGHRKYTYKHIIEYDNRFCPLAVVSSKHCSVLSSLIHLNLVMFEPPIYIYFFQWIICGPWVSLDIVFLIFFFHFDSTWTSFNKNKHRHSWSSSLLKSLSH